LSKRLWAREEEEVLAQGKCRAKTCNPSKQKPIEQTQPHQIKPDEVKSKIERPLLD